jgi:hypothetical protein
VSIEAALAALRDAGATQVVVTFALVPAAPSAPAPLPAPPEPEPTLTEEPDDETLAEDPLFRSTSVRPRRPRHAEEPDG